MTTNTSMLDFYRDSRLGRGGVVGGNPELLELAVGITIPNPIKSPVGLRVLGWPEEQFSWSVNFSEASLQGSVAVLEINSQSLRPLPNTCLFSPAPSAALYSWGWGWTNKIKDGRVDPRREALTPLWSSPHPTVPTESEHSSQGNQSLQPHPEGLPEAQPNKKITAFPQERG